jgi:hypothetical protein
MACTACLVCLASTVSGHHKNTHGKASARSEYITKLEQYIFLRNLWVKCPIATYPIASEAGSTSQGDITDSIK